MRTLTIACRLKKYPRPVESLRGSASHVLHVQRGTMDRSGTITWTTGWLPTVPAPWSAVLADLEVDSPSGTNPGWIVLTDKTAFSALPLIIPQPRKANP